MNSRGAVLSFSKSGLDPSRKQTGLVTALANLKRAIRHKPNRTSTLENAEFLPSLVGQIRRRRGDGGADRRSGSTGIDRVEDAGR